MQIATPEVLNGRPPTIEEHLRAGDEEIKQWFRHIAARDKAEYEYRISNHRP